MQTICPYSSSAAATIETLSIHLHVSQKFPPKKDGKRKEKKRKEGSTAVVVSSPPFLVCTARGIPTANLP